MTPPADETTSPAGAAPPSPSPSPSPLVPSAAPFASGVAGTHVDGATAKLAGTLDTPMANPYQERITALQGDNQRLRDMLAAAGRLAEFGRFAAKQNHELRQPLFAIKGLAQLLLDREQINVDEARDFARHIVEQSERLTRLVGDLRHVAIPAPHTGERAVDVSPILLRVASLLEWRFRKGVTLRTEIASDVPPVAISPHQLEQILINLLTNALDAVAGTTNPVIQVRVARGDSPATRDGVEIDVGDSGTGVARAMRSRLFENFFSTKGDEAGTGLGLAVSREIARGVGGELELLDTPCVWAEPAVTVFRLTLPRAVERALP